MIDFGGREVPRNAPPGAFSECGAEKAEHFICGEPAMFEVKQIAQARISSSIDSPALSAASPRPASARLCAARLRKPAAPARWESSRASWRAWVMGMNGSMIGACFTGGLLSKRESQVRHAVLIPHITLVPFDAMSLEEAAVFVLEGHLGVMFLLIRDVGAHFVGFGFADGKDAVAGLPVEFGEHGIAPGLVR